MPLVFDTAARYFDRLEWTYTVEEGAAFVMRFGGDGDEWTCVGQALEEQRVFLFFSVLPVDVGHDRTAAIAEFVSRANYGMLTGAFELSFDTGDVRYRTSIRLESLPDDAWGDLGLAETLIHEIVRTNLVTMNAYIAGLRGVLAGQAPGPAIDVIESAPG